MTMRIFPNNTINNDWIVPHGQDFLPGPIPMDRGFEMDDSLNNHGELSMAIHFVPFLLGFWLSFPLNVNEKKTFL